MSDMFDNKTYRVMVKSEMTTVLRYEPTRNIADAVFVYGSACGVNLETEWSIFEEIPFRWNTKVCDLEHDLQQLLLQPNRLPDYTLAIGWNDHLSQKLRDWITGKPDVVFKFDI
ncbi:hypothetical protein HPULCUR_010666 [Helicostylum pulchrum]|uniref:Uncharacterized protein n=1 Tax=Helicostylum pulchrum TaxID=562976 RepID=A0ABP9YDW4_9FUNG